jgi:hypothetical protein
MELEYVKREFDLSVLTDEPLSKPVSKVYRYLYYCLDREKIIVNSSMDYIVLHSRTFNKIGKRLENKNTIEISEVIKHFLSYIHSEDLSNYEIKFTNYTSDSGPR